MGVNRFLPFALGCLVPLVAVYALHEPAAVEMSPAGPLPLQPNRAEDARIRYPEHGLPRISLPDGTQQAIRSVLNIRSPMRFGAFAWDENGVADGPVWIRIDLQKQLLSVFRNGEEIGTAVILYGSDGKPTPLGRFTIQAKDADYHSRTYDAPMPFMLRLTDDGVAIHASAVRNGSATHGCIGVPDAFARRLFQLAKLGDPVVIVNARAGIG